jgi:hypothetical protein
MSSRVRSRFVAITAALPLLVVGGPLVTAANAADGVRQADIATTQGALRIGPRAGFRGDVARGVNGNTAIVAIDASSSTTLEKVSVSVTQGGPFSLYDDFDSTDGFALYKDLDDDDRLDVADYDAGPVSLPRYDIGFAGGAVVVTVNADQSKATGEDSYLLTVHPSANISDERVVNFAVPANRVDTTSGTFPGATVTLDDIVLDSRAPAAIPVTNFTAVSRPPLDTCPANAAEDACGDDYYKVYRSAAAETGEQLGFFNAPGDLSDSALLVKPNGASTLPALYDVSGISGSAETPTVLSIGNGTGRDASTPGSRALNNQVSDDVVAVQWDLMGNTVATPLNNTPNCDQNVTTPTCGVHVPRGNDVTAPSLTYSVTMDPVNAASTPNAIAVRGTVSNGADAGVHAWVKRTAVDQLAQPEHVRPVAGSDPVQYTVVSGHVGTEKRSAASPPFIPGNGAGATLITNVDVSNNTLFPQNELVRSQARLVDAAGNAAAPKATAAVLKDTVRPNLVRISMIDGNGNGDPDQGEVYRVEFDDPMDTGDVTSANVNTQLTVKDPAVSSCASAPNFTPCVNWGQGATAFWSDDARILSITLGTPCTTLSQSCTSMTRLPETGDLVTVVSGVTDKNQNTIVNPTSFPIAAPTALAFQARTVDSTGVGTPVYNTDRDGVLDAIDVEFTAPLNAASITDASNAGLFEVSWAGTTVVATGAVGSASDIVRLTFTLPSAARRDWTTGALPVVELKEDNGSTHLKTATLSAIGAFTLTSVDRAAAVPVAMTTKDSNADGKIDQVHVKYSEAIVHASGNPCGYSVAGYGDSTYKPAGFNTVPSAQSCPAGMPGTVNRNEPSPVPAGATASDTVSLKLAVGSIDTNATPSVTYSATNATPTYAINASPPDCMKPVSPVGATTPNCPVKDAAGNGLGSFSGTAADGAGPAILERTTHDVNSDGRLDEIHVKFSETLSTPSIGNALFSVSDPSYTILSLAVLTDKDLAIRLENVAPRQGDTGVKPKLRFFGGTTDLADPPAASPADTGVPVTDKAGPALLGACASSPTGTNGSCPVDDAANDKVTVFLSEAVEPGSVAQADFVVEQEGQTKTQTAAPAFEDSNKRVVLTFAQGTIDSTKEGVVRLAAASAITDATAAGANPSTQTTNVPIYPAPSVTIDLTCPTPANPGYCSADTVNTGAAGTAAVSRWRLSETPRTATPADSEYTEAIPAVYPPSGKIEEGTKTLYLSGKDDFGRLTPEVSDSIIVIKAPDILNVQFVNSAIRGAGTFAKTSTVMDGDTLHIGADAYGTDAAQWAANNAPTGGGCLVAHMSIKLSPLTGTNQNAVPPTKCDLRTTTERPYRQMQFPVVKAAGTTKYPVGTVLKVTDSDPGSMIVDGPGGTLRRRQFISVNARRSWMITDASVIKVPTTLVNAIPRLTNLGYRNGAVLRASSGYYYVHNGTKRPVSTTQLAAWKISTARAYAPTSTELNAMPTGTRITGAAHAAGTWIKYTDGRIYQLVTNAQGATVRRELANSGALRTLVPSTQVYPANSSDSMVPVDTWLRGYRDGTVLKLASGGFAVVARGVVRKFANSQTFNTLGYSTSNAITANGAAIPRVKGQGYLLGATIDRYKIPTVVIKVTNKAGASDSEVVIPSLAGIYGVGTLDPVPNGWDVTR